MEVFWIIIFNALLFWTQSQAEPRKSRSAKMNTQSKVGRSSDRDMYVHEAQEKEQEQLCDDMAMRIAHVVRMDVALTEEEDRLLWTAHYNLTNVRLALLKTADNNENTSALTGPTCQSLGPTDGLFTREEAYLLHMTYYDPSDPILLYWTSGTSYPVDKLALPFSLRDEIIIIINAHILPLLIDHLIHNTRDDSEVLYYTMKGDFLAMLAEISSSENETKEANDDALLNYMTATDIARSIGMSAMHPTRLALARNFAEFYYHGGNSTDQAIALAKEAFQDALIELDLSTSTDQASIRKSTAIMQQLRYNLDTKYTH